MHDSIKELSELSSSMNDEEHCFHMVRRAFLQEDQDAREWVQNSLSETMFDWLHLHPKREAACCSKSEEWYVAQAFTRYWQNTAHHQKLESCTFAVLLRYLQASLNGVVLDALRAAVQPEEVQSSKCERSEEAGVGAFNKSPNVWDSIEHMLCSERQLQLAHLLFRCDLKPAEIVRSWPQEFNNMQEIHCVRQKVLERFLLPDK